MIIPDSCVIEEMLESGILDEIEFLVQQGIHVSLCLPQADEGLIAQTIRLLGDIKEKEAGKLEIFLRLNQGESNPYMEYCLRGAAIEAKKIIFLTCSTGVFDQQKRLINEIASVELEKMTESDPDWISGDMALIVDAAICACKKGVERVHIISGIAYGTLLKEIFSSEGTGTLVCGKAPYEKVRLAKPSEYETILDFFAHELPSQSISLSDMAVDHSDVAIYTLDGEISAAAIWKNGESHIEISHLAISKNRQNSSVPQKIIGYIIGIAEKRNLMKAILRLSGENLLLGFNPFLRELGFSVVETAGKKNVGTVLWERKIQ